MREHAPRVIVSTVGTSMLTNGAPQKLRELLVRTANTPEDGLSTNEYREISTRADEVRNLMLTASPELVQKQSAELNGAVRLGISGADIHYLVATDTLQGRRCSEIAAAWLRTHGSEAVAMPISGLTTADTASFRAGINNLLQWCDSTLRVLREQHRRVVFNLVGGFKAMQAYMQALGMFYADEIVYIFESGNELIRIPRLPVSLDHTPLRTHAALLARLEAGDATIHPETLEGLPEAYLEQVEIDGETVIGLGTWGRAAWMLAKRDILSDELLSFPGLRYESSFRRDYERLSDRVMRMQIQEALARACVALLQGGPQRLRADGSLQYGPLRGAPGIDHFRVTQEVRVTCQLEGNTLILRRCGHHDVIDNP